LALAGQKLSTPCGGVRFKVHLRSYTSPPPKATSFGPTPFSRLSCTDRETA